MLAIRIPITVSSTKAMKSRLLKALPQVKSAHRVEAAARALGFGSHAAMLAAAKSNEPKFASADSDRFLAYLRAHGFDVQSIHMYRAVACVALSNVLDDAPRLSMRGYGFGQPRWIYDQKRWQTSRECFVEFTKNRSEFMSDHALDEFLRALALVRRIPPIKTIRSGTGSYRLKHLAEKMPIALPDGMRLGPDYVSNGAMIAAALHAGFKMKSHLDHLGYDHIDVTFNMPKKIIDDLGCELRPDGGFAQDRARLAERRMLSRWQRRTRFF